MEKMDSICMMLIVIGESLKKLDKAADQKWLSKYPDVDWSLLTSRGTQTSL